MRRSTGYFPELKERWCSWKPESWDWRGLRWYIKELEFISKAMGSCQRALKRGMKSIIIVLTRGLQNFPVTSQRANISGFMSHMVSCNYSTLPLWSKSSHKQHINNQVWLCFNKLHLWTLKFKFEYHIFSCHVIPSFEHFSMI